MPRPTGRHAGRREARMDRFLATLNEGQLSEGVF
jgi:hypothetical protein